MATQLTIGLFFVLVINLAVYGQKHPPFKDSDYPRDKYTIKKEKQSVGVVTVELIHVKPVKQADYDCRGWLMISENGRILKDVTADMESVGGCSGFYFAEKQPKRDLIIVTKFGDYDGRLFVINGKGELKDCLGGSFYVSPDNRYLFSNYDSDLTGVTIVDLTRNEILYTGESELYLGDWYFEDGQYFAIIRQDPVVDKNTWQYVFNLKTRTFKQRVSEKSPSSGNQLKSYNDFTRAPNCQCGK